jgi:hypothetical protein
MMSDDMTNMFSVAAAQQSPLDIQFFTFSAMLRTANAIPKACVLQDPASMCDTGFSDRLAVLNTITMEEILSPELYQQEIEGWNENNHSLDLSDSAIASDMSDSGERCVTKSARTWV